MVVNSLISLYDGLAESNLLFLSSLQGEPPKDHHGIRKHFPEAHKKSNRGVYWINGQRIAVLGGINL
jgi:hypothetical protein